MTKYLIKCSAGISAYLVVPGILVYGCLAAITRFVNLSSECEAIARLNNSECSLHTLFAAVILLALAALILIVSTVSLTNYLLALKL
jgi:hypothetical protein